MLCDWRWPRWEESGGGLWEAVPRRIWRGLPWRVPPLKVPHSLGSVIAQRVDCSDAVLSAHESAEVRVGLKRGCTTLCHRPNSPVSSAECIAELAAGVCKGVEVPWTGEEKPDEISVLMLRVLRHMWSKERVMLWERSSRRWEMADCNALQAERMLFSSATVQLPMNELPMNTVSGPGPGHCNEPPARILHTHASAD
jgi:hypothetical protein